MTVLDGYLYEVEDANVPFDFEEFVKTRIGYTPDEDDVKIYLAEFAPELEELDLWTPNQLINHIHKEISSSDDFEEIERLARDGVQAELSIENAGTEMPMMYYSTYSECWAVLTVRNLSKKIKKYTERH